MAVALGLGMKVMAIAIVLAVGGCGFQTTQVDVDTPVRMRLALDDPEAFACHSQCHPRRAEGTDALAACLRSCKYVDLEVTRSERCSSEDVPPVAECVTLVERRRVNTVDRRSVLAVVGTAAVAFAVGLGAGLAAARTDERRPTGANP